jgi:dipeptidyl aminopeptidase/acylaminoacyl peptidase
VAALLAPLAALAAQTPTLVLSQLTWFDRAGAVLGRLGPLADHGNLEISPDGSQVAVAVSDRGRGTRDIWLYQTDGRPRVQFTSDPEDENWLIWSPDGAHVAVNWFAAGTNTLFERPAAAAGPRTMLVSPSGGVWPVSWSPDGRAILYVTNGVGTSNDIWVLPLDRQRAPYPYQQTQASENWAAFSPDGRWVAFSSTAPSGQPEVYVAGFPSPGELRRVSADGGTQARWRRDGRELYYLAPDRRLMAVPVNGAGETFEAEGAEPLFAVDHPYGAYHAFDVTADGQRFLVNTLAMNPRAPSLRAAR